MIRPQLILDLNAELIVDLFAGGGGASIAIEMATGRHVDIAANHAWEAVAMHRKNHPQTTHFTADVWEIDPREVTCGRPVGWLHASPDCTDHSQAAAGQPRDVQIRSLPWVIIRWAGQVRPRVITMENVKQMRKWGPLIAKRCKETGRVVKIDGTVAARGEIVPVREQHLVADPKRLGQTWRRFIAVLRAMGYAWNDGNMVASDYGAPTSRERLFAVARCDGGPVDFPSPTHFKTPKRGQKRQRAAWECIDFTLPCPSVLITKKQAAKLGWKVQRPLKKNTCVRLAKGTERFVMNAAQPFIVCLTHAGSDRVESVEKSFHTITGANRGERALAMPFLAKFTTGSVGRAIDDQVPTVTANGFKKRPGGSGPLAVASVFIAAAQHKGSVRAATDPMHTISASPKDQNQICAVSLAREFGTQQAADIREPVPTLMAGGSKTQVVAHFLAQNNEGEIGHDARRPMSTIATKAGNQSLVACSIVKYYDPEGSAQDIGSPLHTATTKPRFGLSMADIDVPPLTPEKAARARRIAAWLRKHGVAVPGEFAMCGPFVIWDIGMRMFKPRELYRAQGFPDSYEIDEGIDDEGNRVVFSAEQKIRMCGNSISPPPFVALARHLMPELCVLSNEERRAA